MIENPLPENTSEKQPGILCANCGKEEIMQNYSSQLCSNCRKSFIKYPIPNWVKFFGIATGIVVIICLFTFPKNLSIGIHLFRAEKAASNQNYIDVKNEAKKVLKILPGNEDAKGFLMLSAYYNIDLNTFAKVAQDLANVSLENIKLSNDLNSVMSEANNFFPSDSFIHFIQQYNTNIDSIPQSDMENYLKNNPNDEYAIYQYAVLLEGKNEYTICDSVLNYLLLEDDEYFPALYLRTTIKRMMNQPDSAINYCDKLLFYNHQSVWAMDSKARAMLTQKQDKEALLLAEKAYALDTSNGYSMATLTLAYHFNNLLGKRDDLIRQAKLSKDSLATYYMQYALDVINKKEKFRN